MNLIRKIYCKVKTTTTKHYLRIVTVLFSIIQLSLIGLLLLSLYWNRNYHYAQYISSAMTKIFVCYVANVIVYMVRAFADTVSEKGTKIGKRNK